MKFGLQAVNTVDFPKKESNPYNRPWKPMRLWDVGDPTFLDNWPTDGGEVVSLYSPENIFWYSFLLEADSASRL
jgi:hypothetical protein